MGGAHLLEVHVFHAVLEAGGVGIGGEEGIFDGGWGGISVAELSDVDFDAVVPFGGVVLDAGAEIGDFGGERAGDHGRERAGGIPVDDAEVDVIARGLEDGLVAGAVGLGVEASADFDVRIDLLS